MATRSVDLQQWQRVLLFCNNDNAFCYSVTTTTRFITMATRSVTLYPWQHVLLLCNHWNAICYFALMEKGLLLCNHGNAFCYCYQSNALCYIVKKATRSIIL